MVEDATKINTEVAVAAAAVTTTTISAEVAQKNADRVQNIEQEMSAYYTK